MNKSFITRSTIAQGRDMIFVLKMSVDNDGKKKKSRITGRGSVGVTCNLVSQLQHTEKEYLCLDYHLC